MGSSSVFDTVHLGIAGMPASPSPHAPETPLIKDDPTFAPFLKADFQAADFASEALAGSSSSAQVQIMDQWAFCAERFTGGTSAY